MFRDGTEGTEGRFRKESDREREIRRNDHMDADLTVVLANYESFMVSPRQAILADSSSLGQPKRSRFEYHIWRPRIADVFPIAYTTLTK